MHLEKYQNSLICSDTEVEVWKDTILTTDEGNEYIQDVIEGKVVMENVFDKNYLVDIFQQTQRMKRTLETRQTRL